MVEAPGLFNLDFSTSVEEPQNSYQYVIGATPTLACATTLLYLHMTLTAPFIIHRGADTEARLHLFFSENRVHARYTNFTYCSRIAHGVFGFLYIAAYPS